MPRLQLLARLNEGFNGRLTLISAPAGFGKTTLVTDWLNQPEIQIHQSAWLSLDENDNDVERFFTYLVAALAKIDGRFNQLPLELLATPQTNSSQLILTELLNLLMASSEAILFTLDDYHHITTPAIHESIRFLLDHAPPYFHLLMISRVDPPLPLAKWRARRQMTEIRQDDLRFAAAETSQFLNQLMALDLSETAVDALEIRTEGWIAGLQMAALSLQGHVDTDQFIADFTGSHRYIFDYLTEEVLAKQSAETRDFLLKTAVLDQLHAPLCDAVLAGSGAQSILEQLEAANLFLVPLDHSRRWYRYHHLFADLLRQQLRREDPALEVDLHSRASLWYAQNGFADEAVHHALAAANYAQSAALMAQYSESLVVHGEINKLLAWIGRLPAEWQRKEPGLILNHAWALLFRSSAAEVEAVLATMSYEVASVSPYSASLLVLRGTLAARQGDTVNAIALSEAAEAQLVAADPHQANPLMRGANALILANSYRQMGDHDRAQPFYQTAVSLSRQSGNYLALLSAIRSWGTLLAECGRLHQAAALLKEGLQAEQEWVKSNGNRARNLLAAAPLYAALAQIYIEWDRLDDVETLLENGLRLLLLSNSIDQSEGLVAQARLHLAKGDVEAVPPILKQLEMLQASAKIRLERRPLLLAVSEVRCGLYAQQPTAALRSAIEQSLGQFGSEPTETLAQTRSLLALSRLTLSRAGESRSLLEDLAKTLQEDGRHGLWLSAMVLLCQAQHALGEMDKALGSLQQALRIAEPEEYVHLFVDGGEWIFGLLKTAVQQKIGGEYAKKLLENSRRTISDSRLSIPPNMVGRDARAPHSLTPREIEVLQLIAQGLSNNDIAQKLIIAPSTAKRHTINIYNKLGISNRAEATARAYELELIKPNS